MKTKLLSELKQTCENCTECELSKTRTNIVFADGNPQTATIILIGEAPGENEDLTGKPFVGKAGKLLNEMLEKVGIDREKDLYIINTLKCRPPKNRTPKKSEKKLCEKYLFEQIKIISPKVIILCGSTALASFSNEKIKNFHGQWFDINGVKSIAILHPASKRYIKGYDELTLADLTKVSKFMAL